MQNQPEPLDWRDGTVPVSRRFDDPYYSLDDGLAETTHVFLDGNGLPERFCDGFHIAELGFGTGLNLLTTLMSWRGSGQNGTLRFTSFEAYPMAAEDMIRAQAAFPSLAEVAAELAPFWRDGATQITLPDLEFRLITGDARISVPAWDRRANAWFLDGFSPAKNPELWQADLLQAVANKTAPTGTCATYSAAGAVRRALEGAGFGVSRVPGFGRKRHMTIGTLDKR